MKINKLFELPFLSSEAHCDSVLFEDLKLRIKLQAVDGSALSIVFQTVLCHLHTSESFTGNIMDAYDTIVEIEDSEWIKKLKDENETNYRYWKLKHYAIYIEDLGFIQCMAKGFETEHKDGSLCR